VKTTPNPRATKNNKGELGPPFCLEFAVGDGVAEVSVGDEASDDNVDDMFAMVFCQYPIDDCGQPSDIQYR